MKAQNGLKWSHVLHDRLSPRTIEILDRANLRRDPALSCDAEKLRQLLLRRNLPVYGPVLEYERRIGSVFETVALFDAGVRGRTPLTPDSLPRYDDRRLMPVGYWTDPHYEEEPDDDLYDYLMDECGVCYLKDRESGDTRPIAESYLALIERHAFSLNFQQTACLREGSSRWRHEVEIYPEQLAGTIADTMNVPAFAPATDTYGGIWERNDVVIQCCSHANTVRVRTAHFEGAVCAIQAAYTVKPRAVVRWSSHDYGSPPLPGEPIAHRLPAFGYRGEEDGEFLVIGTVGRYRLHRTKGDARASASKEK